MSKKISDIISDIRFPLCIAVVCIHSSSFVTDLDGWGAFILNLSGQYLPGVAVPCFFFISGYLSAKSDNFSDPASFGAFLKRRISSLLPPYLIWNIIAFITSWIINISPLGAYTSGGLYDYVGVLQLLKDLFWEPRLIPLWFVRNLMIIILVSPLIFFFVKKFPIATLISLYLMDYIENAYFIGGIFYFGAGMALRLHIAANGMDRGLNRGIWLFPLFIVWSILQSADIIPAIIESALSQSILLAGVLGSICLCSRTISTPSIFRSGGLVFFVYALHGIITPYIIKLLTISFNPTDSVEYVSIFFATVILSMVICITAYSILSRYSRPIVETLTGSRL